jgi:UDP-glucose 4-epimerase
MVRPFNSFGPRSHHEGDSGEVIPKFLLRSMLGQPMIIFGDGSQRRDFTYVSDTARGILLAGQNDQAIGETINLGSGAEVDINTLAEEVAKLLGHTEAKVQRGKARAGDVLRLLADSSKAQQLLNYKACISLQTGLSFLHRWYLDKQQNLEHLLKEEIVYNWEK